MAIETVLGLVVWQLSNGGVKVLIRGASCHKGLEMERWRMGRGEVTKCCVCSMGCSTRKKRMIFGVECLTETWSWYMIQL